MADQPAVTRTFALLPLQGGKLKRYGVALLAMTVALALRSVFQPILGGSMHYVSISAATVFAAWYCGLWPAVLATMLGTLAANALFLSPYRPLGPFTVRGIIGQLLFLVLSAGIIAVGEGGGWAVRRLCHGQQILLNPEIQAILR